MEAASAAAFGLVLAACAGLRAFLPVFGASVAIRTLGLEVPPSLAWMASTTTIIIFGVATVLEVLGDKIPVVDHLLDTVQTFTKPGLAVLAAIPFVHQLAPEHSVALAIVAGAPLALGVHTAKASARVGSTAFTGGLANPVISLIEDVAAVVLIILGLIAPILALLLAVALLWRLVSYARKMARRRAASGGVAGPG
jgi:hypothetical protein